MLSAALQTKFIISPGRDGLVARPQLIDQLTRGVQPGQRLLLITAPPGYGKPTLLSAWAGHSTLRVCWLSLDEGDNDLNQFWLDLARALAAHVPHLLAPIETLLHGDPCTNCRRCALGRVDQHANARDQSARCDVG